MNYVIEKCEREKVINVLYPKTNALQIKIREYLVEKNQSVKAGQPLLRFSKKEIAAAGKKDTVVCVVM